MQRHFPIDPATGAENSALAWQNGVPASGIEGSYPPFQLCTDPQDEILNAIAASGETGTDGDLTQLIQAIAIGIDIGTFGGAANALTATIPGAVAIPTLRRGMTVKGIIGFANTNASPNLAVTGFTIGGSAIAIKKRDGSALAAGDLPLGAYMSFRFDGTLWRTEGLLASDVTAITIVTTPPPTTTSLQRTVGTFGSGSNTLGVPSWAKKFGYRIWAGGGAGGNGQNGGSAGGGGGGEYREGVFLVGAGLTVTPSETLTLMVGAGGAVSGSNGANGGNGGSSAIAGLVACVGGSGGVGTTTGYDYTSGGAGGTGGSGGDFAYPGMPGAQGQAYGNGVGGASFGGSVNASEFIFQVGSGIAGFGPGCGGSGSGANTGGYPLGGAGAAGRIDYFFEG